MNKGYYTKITSDIPRFSLNLKEVRQYRELIGVLTKKAFAVRYRQTVLGPLWLFLSPVFSSLISMLVFGGIAHLGTGDVPPFLFYLSGNAVWIFFEECIIKNANTFRGNAHMFSKVYFPRMCVSVSYLLSDLCDFLIRMFPAVILVVYYCIIGDLEFNFLRILLVPAVILLVGIMAMSLGMLFSSLTTKYRDFSVLLKLGLTLWMPITPVAYPLSEITDPFIRKCFFFNPMTGFLELFRYALLGKGQILTQNLIFGCTFTAVLAVVSIMVFNRVERNCMDTI